MKTTIHNDALNTLGTIIDGNEKRDAVHLAVEPVVAANKLNPGDHIGFTGSYIITEDKSEIKEVSSTHNPVGIVDPFLKESVLTGEIFWMIVYPRKITSLRHFWTHPDFDNVPISDKKNKCPNGIAEIFNLSLEWIINYAKELGLSHQELMNGANEFIRNGNHLIGYETEDIGSYGSYASGGLLQGELTSDEFWIHYEIVTGTKVEDSKKTNFFDCSC